MRKLFVWTILYLMIILYLTISSAAAGAGFIDNGDGTVTDTSTGLMWQRVTASRTYTWEQALSYCENLTHAGYSDWRLPTIKELASLADLRRYNPAIDTAYFPGTAWSYWSSTTYDYTTSDAWLVSFYDGDEYYTNKSNWYYARAVRGGQNRLSGHLVIWTPEQAADLKVGAGKIITWDTQGIPGDVRIELSREGGKDGTFETLTDSTENDGSYAWAVTGPASSNCMLKIEPLGQMDKGSVQGLFSIEVPTARAFKDSGQSLGILNSEGIALGDLDGDGDLDAFVGNTAGQANKVWLNDGMAAFTASGQNLGDSNSVFAALGDVDGDDDLDAVAANDGQANKVWLNNGSGIFTDSGQNLGSSNSRALAMGDFNGDGDLDIFAANDGQANTVWLNNGSGVFTDSGQSLGAANSRAVALGDVDGDGELDAIVANSGQGNKVWLNDGTGTFTDSGQNLGNSDSESIALADVDGDGDLDAFVGNFFQANRVWVNNAGIFSDSGQTLGTFKSRAVTLIDIDLDGDPDAFVANDGEGCRVWVNNGLGAFSDSGLGYGGSDSYGLSMGNLNGDSYPDAFVANSNGQGNKVWLNTAGPFADSGQNLGNVDSMGVALGDIDGDGDPDAFFANNGLDAVWLNADGAGTYTSTAQAAFSSYSGMAVALGDLDGDRDLDAFVANDGISTVWLNADGAGTYTSTVQAAFAGYSSTDAVLGDLNGDGHLDAVLANNGQGNKVWFNDGNATFADSGQSLGASNSQGLALGDLDGDGHLDAFIANSGQGNRVWFNNGTGTFVDSLQSLGGSNSMDVALGDVDGDGDLDAMVANSGQVNKVWFNEGAGTFVDSGQSLGTSISRGVVFFDLDRDGDLDAYVANAGEADKVWINDGEGTFSDRGLDYGALDSYGVSVGDIDGDGDLDVLVAGVGPNRVWRNDFAPDPIQINPAAKTQFESAAGAYTYTATGGNLSGTHMWTSSNPFAGTIDSATGVFTPATVSTGSQITMIRAADPTFSNIFTEIQVTVFAKLSLGIPSSYVEDDPSTYPVLSGAGALYFVTVDNGTGGDYTWRILDAGGAQVVGPEVGGTTFGVHADTLFALNGGNGAGVYTVEAADANTDFDRATTKIAIPMRIAPMTGSYKETDGGVNFTVTGNAGPFTWTVTDESGALIAVPDFGFYTGTNAAMNFFQFTPGVINGITTFRAEVQSADLTLADAGLDMVMTGSHVIAPVPVFNIEILGSDTGGAGVVGAMITAAHDSSYSATTIADGTAAIAGLINTGVTYNFAVEAAGYMPTLFSVTDTSTTKTLTLEKITQAGTISGTITPAGVGTTVKVMKSDGTFIKNISGETLQVLADAVTGGYTLTFETAADANAGPYTIHAYRSGYVTHPDDNAGVLGVAAVNTTGNDITLNQVTKITITDDGGSPNVTFSVTASPAFTNAIPTEIRVFEGTSDSGNAVTAGLNFAGGTYTYAIATPDQGTSAGIFVRADTSTDGRDAGSGYYASRSAIVVNASVALTESIINDPNFSGGTAQSISGDTRVSLPAGGLVGGVIPQVTVTISETEAQKAAGTGSVVTGSDIVGVNLIDTATGTPIGGDAISKIYITIKFDPARVPVGSLESGAATIYHGSDLAAMVAGNVTVVPVPQIVLPVDYAKGFVTFWATSLGSFGIGGIVIDAQISSIFVQHRKFESGIEYNRLYFKLTANGNPVTEDIISYAELYDPSGNLVDLRDRGLATSRLFKGRYEPETGQWSYDENFTNSTGYYYHFYDPLMPGTYHLKVFLPGQDPVERDYTVNARVELPEIPSQSFKACMDESGNLTWHWDVPDSIDPRLSTSIRTFIRTRSDGTESNKILYVTIPTLLGYAHVPNTVLDKFKEEGETLTFQIQIRTNDDNNRYYSDKMPFDEITFSECPPPNDQHSVPGIVPTYWWGAYTRNESSGHRLKHGVTIIDHDGICHDGSLHTVTVTYPEGSTRNVPFYYRSSFSEGIFYLSDNSGSYSPGNYVYTVTDSAGNSSSYTDTVDTIQAIAVADFESITVTAADTFSTVDWTPVSDPAVVNYQVRIYTTGGSSVFSEYAKNPPYKIPPGVLDPHTSYKCKIEAYAGHQWFDQDNISRSDFASFTTGAQVQTPYIDVSASRGVSTYNNIYDGEFLFFFVYVYDAQGVPENIRSVKVLFPDNTTEIPLFLSEVKSAVKGSYIGWYLAGVISGTYTFIVEDKDNNTFQTTRDLSPRPLVYPDIGSLIPAHNTVIDTSDIHCQWDPVDGAAFYELRISDRYDTPLYWFRTEDSHFTFSKHILKKNEPYKYRVKAVREFYEDGQRNVSVSSWRTHELNIFAGALTGGSSPPQIDLENQGAEVAHRQKSDLVNSEYGFYLWAKVIDPDGVPDNIASVRAIDPDGQPLDMFYYEEISPTEAYYIRIELHDLTDTIKQGEYTFVVTDFDGNSAEATDTLVIQLLPHPTNQRPVDGATNVDVTPTIQWDPVAGAARYRVNIYTNFDTEIHESDVLTATSYTVSYGVLDVDSTYFYRVHAFREAYPDQDLDNSSHNVDLRTSKPLFHTAPSYATGGISGKITATVAGQSISVAGAMVTLMEIGRSTTSDADGNYTIADVPVGTYTVKIEKENFEVVLKSNVSVQKDQTTPVTVTTSYRAEESLLQEGRSLLFNQGAQTYSGLIAANEKFKAASAADPANEAANFFYAVTRMLVFALEQENGPDFGIIDTLRDLFGAFGATRNNIDSVNEDSPFTDLPSFNDDYDPPETVPGGEEVRGFISGPFLTLLDSTISNLDAVDDPFDITLFADETGMEDVEIDYGDVLVFKSSLYTLKAHALIASAYDQNVPSMDIRDMIAFNNADLFQIQQDLLDRYQEFLKLRGDGTALLADAWQALNTGIDLFRDALDYITGETDYQGDDLLYFEENTDINDAKVALTILMELQESIEENREADFKTFEEKWILTDESDKRLFVTVEKDKNGNIADDKARGMDGCDFLFCSGRVEEFKTIGSQVTIQLASKDWGCPVFATLRGTLSGSKIINGVYEETTCFETRSGTFTGDRICKQTETERFDFNYLFGNTGKPPLDIREVIPRFDQYNEMAPGSFPPIDGSAPVLNGLMPDYPTNDDLTKKLELEPSGSFTIPAATITIDGDPGDWPPQAVVFEDVSGDGDPNKSGTDLEKLYLAKDAEYLYAGMSFYDGDPTHNDGMTHLLLRLRSRYDQSTPVLDISTSPINSTWEVFVNKDPWGEWEYIGYYGDYGAASAGFLEWKAPLSDIEEAIGSLNGKFVSALIGVPASSDPCAQRDYRDDNHTMIQLNLLSDISGTISFPDYTSGSLSITAYDWHDPKYATKLGEMEVSAPGPYTITGLPEGENVYIYARWDSDANGIVSFGDYWGMTGPVLLAGGSNAIAIDMVNEIDDSYILTKPGKYRIFGNNTYIIPPFMWPRNPNEIAWGDGWTFIGEGDPDSPNTFDTPVYFKTILIIWDENSNFYFDAFEDLTAGTAFATYADGTESGFSWQTSGLKNFDEYVYNWWGEPTYFKGRPDGLYARAGESGGFLLFTMPDDAVPLSTGRKLEVTMDGDADRDGLPDWVETGTGDFSAKTDTGSDPTNPDSDGDGMPDGWEVSFGLNPVSDDADQDPDEDGVTNREEYQAESDPETSDALWTKGSIMNRHKPDGSFDTIIDVQLSSGFPGILPDDVESITIIGPSGKLPYVLNDYKYVSQFRIFEIVVPGSPEIGTYTFHVKGGHNWMTGESYFGKATDFQGANMTIPVPDASKLFPADGATVTSKTPVFSWPAVDFSETTMYYRMEIRDEHEQGDRLYATGRVEDMLSHTVPEGILEPGTIYKWRVRVSDSYDWIETRNRSNTDYIYFTTADSFTHSSPPAFYTDSLGAYTWSTSSGERLYYWVTIKDIDGVASDGMSHTVTVMHPDWVTTRTLGYQYHSTGDTTSAYYSGGEPSSYSPTAGDYTFTVTDPDGNTGTYVDTLELAPLDPPDEDSFTLSRKGETITAFWDNVYVNGRLYEDFSTTATVDDIDPDKWEYVRCDSVSDRNSIDKQRLKFIKQGMVGCSQCRLKFANGGSVNSIRADVTTDDISSDVPYSRIYGYFYNDGERDVYAKVNVYAEKVTWSVTYNIYEGGTKTNNTWEGRMLSFNTIAKGDLMTGISPGDTITISISWDGSSLTFGANGNTATFTPSGTVRPPENTTKMLITRIYLTTDTTPEFSWDPVPGANHYRVRIFNYDGTRTVWSGYTGYTSYTVPPGVLMPNAGYEYRIYARDSHFNLERDNRSATPASSNDYYRFYTSRGEDPNPFIDLADNGVRTWTGDTKDPYLSLWLKVHDAQGVPGDIASVTVKLPDGVEVPLYFDYTQTSTRGIYRGHLYREDIQGGTYTFTVKDRDGNTHSKDEELTKDPIGYPSPTSLEPVHGSVINGTAVDFDWEDVDGAAFYRVEIYDRDHNLIYNFATINSEYHLAAGFLEEGRLYRYRVITRREFYEENVDNGSSSPWGKYHMPTFLTTPTEGSSPPGIITDDWTDNQGAFVWHSVKDGSDDVSAFWLFFQVKISDPDGVPGNIATVRVTYPDKETMRDLAYHEEVSPTEATYLWYEAYGSPDDIQEGAYMFTVTDFEGNIAEVFDDLSIDILPVPANCTPGADSTVSGSMTFIDWNDVPRAAGYKVRIFDGWYDTVHESPIFSGSIYSIPAGVLEPHSTYSYRVYAYREPYPDSDVDNISTNRFNLSQLPHFTIGADDTDPAIASFSVTDTATAGTYTTTSRTVNIRLTASDDSKSTLRYLITETPDTPSVEQMFSASTLPAMTYDIQSPGEGAKTLYAWAMDPAGNISLAAIAGIYLDTRTTVSIDPVTTPTHIDFQTIGGLREQGSEVTVTCTTAAVSAVKYPTDTTWSAVLSEFAPGDNAIAVAATDAYGNQDTKQATIRYSAADTAAIEPDDPNVIADGQSATRLAITLNDANGQPVSDGYKVQVLTTSGEISGPGSSIDGVVFRTLKAPVNLGVATVTVKDPGATRVLGTGEVTFIAGPAIKLVFNTPEQSTVANEWSSYITVQTRDAYDHPAPVYEDARILLASDSPSGRFETFESGVSAANSQYLTIFKGTSYRGFYYKDSAQGSMVITADETPDSGWPSDTYKINVTDSAPHSAIITADPDGIHPDPILANGMDTVSLSIEVRDINGNIVTDGTIVTVVTDRGTITGSGGSVNGVILRNIKSGIVPGLANLTVTDNRGVILPGGVAGDVSLTFMVDNPLRNALADPQSGYGDTSYAFTLDYINPDNPPVSKVMVLDGVGIEMTLVSGDADHGTYKCEVSGLEPGASHQYYFIFNDGAREYHLPASGIFSGPIVKLRTCTIIANLSKSDLTYGEELTVSGSAVPARKADIEVHFKAPDGTLYTKTATTNTDGFYTLDFAPDQIAAGESYWSVRAISLPDNVYDLSESPEQKFSVSKADTSITADVTPRLLSAGGKVAVEGRLVSEKGGFLDSVAVDIVFIKPDATEIAETVYTDAEGYFALSGFGKVTTEGDWTVQARFNGNAYFNAKYSQTIAMKVSRVAGYAVLVQGKLNDESLMAWHNKTANNIYNRLKGLGFTDEDIYYFNYDDTQAGVDEVTSKGSFDPVTGTGDGIEYAVKKWARSKMNSVPAPLYIIFVDHGGDNVFYLGAEYITADELDGWLGYLEDNLLPASGEEKIVFIYGACYSGSFIKKLSRPDKNRIIITSADEKEVSYPDSPPKGKTTADGEFFLKKFFRHASTGKTIKRCFELAANATQKRYRVPILRNSFGWKHGDSGIQHPILDDNGDGKGTHYLPTAPPGDGFVVHDMVIGIPPEDPENVVLNQISPLITLEGGNLSEPLWAKVSNNARCESVWIAIKAPGASFSYTETRFGVDPDWPKEACGYNEAEDRYEYDGTLTQTPLSKIFDRYGIYEIYFYARDSQTGNISDFKRGYLIHTDDSNISAPAPFKLLRPEDGEQRASSLTLAWEEAVDPDGGKISYILQIAQDDTFDDPIFQSVEESNFFIVDKFCLLENLQTYYWRVMAVDESGGETVCSQGRHGFTTFNGNGIPGLLIGYVDDATNKAPISGAFVEILNLSGINTRTRKNGWFILSVPSGEYNMRILAQGFDEKILPVNIQSENRSTLSVGLNATGDRIDPVVTIDDPECPRTVSYATYTIKGTAVDEGGSYLSGVEVSTDNGANWSPATGLNPWSYEADLEIGDNIILVRAFDNAERSSEAGPCTLTFSETSKPTVTGLILDPPSPVKEGTVTFTITFSEDMNTDIGPGVVFGSASHPVASHAVTGQYVDSRTWEGVFAIGTGYDGDQVIRVSGALDIYGNFMDEENTYGFVVDTTCPSEPVISTMPQTVKSNAFIITLSKQSADANFSHYQLKGGRYEDWTDTFAANNFFFALLPESENILKIRGVDRAGNRCLHDEVRITRASRLDMGDINGDQEVGLIDAIIVIKVMNHRYCPEVTFRYAESGADVNDNGKIGIEELLYILKKVADL